MSRVAGLKTMAEVIIKNVKKVYPLNEKKLKKSNGQTPNEPAANLQITDEGVVAVQQFSLDIADKEFIVLVGPSGCGKSTTLRMIAGLEEINDGELYIDGNLMNDVPPKDRDIAMVFQNYALYPHMTVFAKHGLFSEVKEGEEKCYRAESQARSWTFWKSLICLDRKPIGSLRRPASARCHRTRHR